MTALPPIGTVFEEPGFRGEVIGHFSGMMVIEGRLEGKLAAHAGQTDEFAVVIDGAITVTANGKTETLRTGQSVIVPAGTMHAVEARAPARLLLIG